MGNRTVLSNEELSRRAAQLKNWKVDGNHHLARSFQFPNFLEALNLVNRIGAIAEQQGHHPEIRLGWGHVDVETWTHDAGGITESDFRLASAIDDLK